VRNYFRAGSSGCRHGAVHYSSLLELGLGSVQPPSRAPSGPRPDFLSELKDKFIRTISGPVARMVTTNRPRNFTAVPSQFGEVKKRFEAADTKGRNRSPASGSANLTEKTPAPSPARDDEQSSDSNAVETRLGRTTPGGDWHGDVVTLHHLLHQHFQSRVMLGPASCKKGGGKGLQGAHVKTSLAPGSEWCSEYLKEQRPAPYRTCWVFRCRLRLHDCNRNSGPLIRALRIIVGNDLIAASVRQATANFEARSTKA